jgi:hypothetical protein
MFRDVSFVQVYWAQGLNPGEARDFSVLQNFQTGCGAHTASYSMVTGVLSQE